jgi:hypothetical protein
MVMYWLTMLITGNANRTGDRPIIYIFLDLHTSRDPHQRAVWTRDTILSLRQRRHDACFHSPSEHATSFVGSGQRRIDWIDSLVRSIDLELGFARSQTGRADRHIMLSNDHAPTHGPVTGLAPLHRGARRDRIGSRDRLRRRATRWTFDAFAD